MGLLRSRRSKEPALDRAPDWVSTSVGMGLSGVRGHLLLAFICMEVVLGAFATPPWYPKPKKPQNTPPPAGSSDFQAFSSNVPPAKVYNKPMEDYVPHPYMKLGGIRMLDCDSCKRIARKALRSFPDQLFTNRNIAWYNVCENPKSAKGFPWQKGAFGEDIQPFVEACHGLLQDGTLLHRFADKVEPYIQTMICRRICSNGPGTVDEPYHDPWLPYHGRGPWGYAEYPDRVFNKDEWKPTNDHVLKEGEEKEAYFLPDGTRLDAATLGGVAAVEGVDIDGEKKGTAAGHPT